MATEVPTFLSYPAQIDLGNFAVGIGTTLLAIATFISIFSYKRASVSNFRKEWIENLRIHMADFIGAVKRTGLENSYYATAVKKGNLEEASKINKERNNQLMKILYGYDYISLMLNSDEKQHKILIDCMKSDYSKAVHSINPDAKRTENQEEQDKLPKTIEQARLVLKTEWERVKKHN
jgi:hypothetical protein